MGSSVLGAGRSGQRVLRQPQVDQQPHLLDEDRQRLTGSRQGPVQQHPGQVLVAGPPQQPGGQDVRVHPQPDGHLLPCRRYGGDRLVRRLDQFREREREGMLISRGCGGPCSRSAGVQVVDRDGRARAPGGLGQLTPQVEGNRAHRRMLVSRRWVGLTGQLAGVQPQRSGQRSQPTTAVDPVPASLQIHQGRSTEPGVASERVSGHSSAPPPGDHTRSDGADGLGVIMLAHHQLARIPLARTPCCSRARPRSSPSAGSPV